MSTNTVNHPDIEQRPKLLTSKEAATLLSISPRKLWSLTNSHEVPHIRIGRSVRYIMADLGEWIQEQRCAEPKRSPIIRNDIPKKPRSSSSR